MEKLKIYSCNQERTLKMGIEKRPYGLDRWLRNLLS